MLPATLPGALPLADVGALPLAAAGRVAGGRSDSSGPYPYPSPYPYPVRLVTSFRIVPSTVPLTCASFSVACRSSARLVWSAATTISVPSASFDSSMASVTGSTGGLSMSTRSNFARSAANTACVAGPFSNSAGLAGSAPAPSIQRVSCPFTRCTASISDRSPSSTVVSPACSSRPKNCPSRGRRRSHDTMTTRSPVWAKTTPRFATAEVLPSAAPGLVTTRVRSLCSCL